MRELVYTEVQSISGGEAQCTVSLGTSTTVSCTGTVSELGTVAAQIYSFLAVSPFTVPGIIQRLS